MFPFYGGGKGIFICFFFVTFLFFLLIYVYLFVFHFFLRFAFGLEFLFLLFLCMCVFFFVSIVIPSAFQFNNFPLLLSICFKCVLHISTVQTINFSIRIGLSFSACFLNRHTSTYLTTHRTVLRCICLFFAFACLFTVPNCCLYICFTLPLTRSKGFFVLFSFQRENFKFSSSDTDCTKQA